jgi:glycosyltransferase involved in cell wall biosynthesis
MSEQQLADWYADLDCFVSLSTSEGWGLMPLQAMATGRACIAIPFGGHREYFSHHVGLPARFSLTPAGYNYEGGGVWAMPEREHVIELMRYVYSNRSQVLRMGRRAAKYARKFSWARSNKELAGVLREFSMIK